MVNIETSIVRDAVCPYFCVVYISMRHVLWVQVVGM